MNKSIEIKKQIQELQEQLRQEEKKEKSKKGVLKEGEWYLLSIYDLDEKEKVKKDTESNVVFYMSCSGEPTCMNAYVEWYSKYICDLLQGQPYYEKWKGKKISKEEAIKYL